MILLPQLRCQNSSQTKTVVKKSPPTSLNKCSKILFTQNIIQHNNSFQIHVDLYKKKIHLCVQIALPRHKKFKIVYLSFKKPQANCIFLLQKHGFFFHTGFSISFLTMPYLYLNKNKILQNHTFCIKLKKK